MLQTISPDLLPFITTVINGSLMSVHVPTAQPSATTDRITSMIPTSLASKQHIPQRLLFWQSLKLHAARSAKLSSVLILLNLSAAFDTVNNKTLLSTLRSLGICGTAWEWFASYLDGRSYQLYPHMSFHTTAMPIFSFFPSNTMASARISACLVDISSWMTAHQLKLNPSKTELLVIPGDPSPAQDLALSLNNSKISPSATAHNIGVTMDNQLSFSSHVA
ncbi:hypothetical protein QTP70_019409, partial [Hemibagrus guttatus]